MSHRPLAQYKIKSHALAGSDPSLDADLSDGVGGTLAVVGLLPVGAFVFVFHPRYMAITPPNIETGAPPSPYVAARVRPSKKYRPSGVPPQRNGSSRDRT